MRKWRVRYICLHPPSYTVDRHRLQAKPTVTKRRSLENILWAHFQFYSDLSHHDVLEEGCHLLYCSGEIGSSTFSPDSRCRRFLIETAARKSDRSFTGPFLPDLFKVRYHCPWFLFFSSGVRRFKKIYSSLLVATSTQLFLLLFDLVSLLLRSLLSYFWLKSAAMSVFSPIFPFFYHCCLCIWNFHCSKHRNEFVNETVMNHRIHPFCSNVILMRFVSSPF